MCAERPAFVRGGGKPRPALLPSFLLHHQSKAKLVAPPFSLPPKHLAGLPALDSPVYIRDLEPWGSVCVCVCACGQQRDRSAQDRLVHLVKQG